LIISVFADSWLFIFLSGILINGIGMSFSEVACEMGIFACIVFYALSKVLIYIFLIEKVYIVWPNRGSTRWTSGAYRLCLVSVSGYAVMLVILIIGRIAFRQADGQCIIGLAKFASLSLLVYDLLLNVFLTAMFLFPLRRRKFMSDKLRSVARRTLAAATMALLTSAVNITVLTILHGQELGWVCLGSCGTDVTLNALVLFWVTSSKDESSSPSNGPMPNSGNNAISGVAPFTLSSNKPPVFSQESAPHSEPSNGSRHSFTPRFSSKDKAAGPHEMPSGIGRRCQSLGHSATRPLAGGRKLGLVSRVAQAFRRDAEAQTGEARTMSVQITVTTQTDADVVEEYKHRPHSNSDASSSKKEGPDHCVALDDPSQDIEKQPHGI